MGPWWSVGVGGVVGGAPIISVMPGVLSSDGADFSSNSDVVVYGREPYDNMITFPNCLTRSLGPQC